MNVEKELAALRRLSVGELRLRYAELFGETTSSRHKTWLVKRIIWRLQAQAEGDLSERARRRAEELARDADLRLSPPRAKPPASRASQVLCPPTPIGRRDGRLPPPGTIITRKYKGEMLQVKVLPQGFEFEGQFYKSLSAVAKRITGCHCNGYLFFRLGARGVGRGVGSRPCPTALHAKIVSDR